MPLTLYPLSLKINKKLIKTEQGENEMEGDNAFRAGLGRSYDPTVLLFIWLEEIHRFPILSQDEERELIRRWQENGDIKARDKLLLHNLGFATWLARKFCGHGVEDLDLIQEATMGLMIAIDRFSLAYPFKLISYASWWIKVRVLSCIRNNGNTFHIPANVYVLIAEIQNARRKLYDDFGCWPSAEEIADETEIPLEKVTDILVIIKRRFISLDSPVYENKDGKQTLFSSVVKGPCLNPETILLAKEEIEEIRKVIRKIKFFLKESHTISETQRLIFLLRYGIEETDDDLEETALEKVGKNHKIRMTREGIRLSINSTWHKLHMAGIPKKINHDWLVNAANRLVILNEV